MMTSGSDGPVHDSWILSKHETVKYSDLDWAPPTPQSSDRYCVMGRDKAATCLLRGACLSGGNLLFESHQEVKNGCRGKCTGGTTMPKVVAFSRDKYTTFGLGPFGVEEVLLQPVSSLPPSNVSRSSTVLNPDISQSLDTVFVMLHPYNPGEWSPPLPW